MIEFAIVCDILPKRPIHKLIVGLRLCEDYTKNQYFKIHLFKSTDDYDGKGYYVIEDSNFDNIITKFHTVIDRLFSEGSSYIGMDGNLHVIKYYDWSIHWKYTERVLKVYKPPKCIFDDILRKLHD